MSSPDYNKLSYFTDKFFSMLEKSTVNLEPTEIKCFLKAENDFLHTGDKADAFSIYYCFSEIFNIFGIGYDNTKKLIEILSDYEYHAGALLEKHRDHYSHSVYVFSLGLAVYIECPKFRKAFADYYGIEYGDAYGFLYLWGVTSLFHDVGYPFEIAHDEIRTFVNKLGVTGDMAPYVSYGALSEYIKLSDDDKLIFKNAVGTTEDFVDLNKVFSYWLNKRIGYDRSAVEKVLIGEQSARKYQDHAYFSAILLSRFMLRSNPEIINSLTLDAVMAILLHNSLNRFNYGKFSRRLNMDEYPLAYMLLLCDNLQDWDREAYGIKTAAHPQAWNAVFKIDNESITGLYMFNSYMIYTPDTCISAIENKKVIAIKNGSFAAEVQDLLGDGLIVKAECSENPKNLHSFRYASTYSFVNLCDFAKSIHANYVEKCYSMDTEYLNKAFGELSLEEKLSNIDQAKSYSHKLELINCFFSDKELDYPVVEKFKEGVKDSDDPFIRQVDEVEFLAREEHVRWVKEKLSMGWHYGTSYIDSESGIVDREKRNLLREHADMLPYDLLDEDTKEKDRIMIRNMVPFLWRHGDGTRIYRYRNGFKPVLDIVAVGHRKIIGDISNIKYQIKEILKNYARDYTVVVRSCFAPGADQLVMECANELGLTTKASLPLLIPAENGVDINDYDFARRNVMAYLSHMYVDAEANGFKFTKEDENKMLELLAQTAVCHITADKQYTWMEPAKHIINKCHKMIALWDGIETKLEDSDGQPINRGGTYHCIHMAQMRSLRLGKDIHIIKIDR